VPEKRQLNKPKVNQPLIPEWASSHIVFTAKIVQNRKKCFAKSLSKKEFKQLSDLYIATGTQEDREGFGKLQYTYKWAYSLSVFPQRRNG
jgi:hypothetical protein